MVLFGHIFNFIPRLHIRAFPTSHRQLVCILVAFILITVKETINDKATSSANSKHAVCLCHMILKGESSRS